MKPDIIEQLKTVQQIAEAAQKGQSIEWEVNDNELHPHEFLAFTGLAVAPRFLHPPGRYTIRIKPWTLGRSVNGHTLPDGAEWHRQDWIQSMLPAPYRPLMVGETVMGLDEMATKSYPITWHAQSLPESGIAYQEWFNHYLYRTTRPIPIVEKWAAEKAAFEEGKKPDNAKFKNDAEWRDYSEEIHFAPGVGPSCIWRIKPEPVFIDLGPEDIEPNSVFRIESWPEGCHCTYQKVHPVGLSFSYSSTEVTKWDKLRRDGWLIHRPSSPDLWQRCEKLSPN